MTGRAPSPIWPLHPTCPVCGHDDSRDIGRTPSGALAKRRCRACGAYFKAAPIGFRVWQGSRERKDSCADEPLARTLRREAKALGDLSDRLCSAINDHGDRRHPRVQIISEIKSAVGELAEA